MPTNSSRSTRQSKPTKLLTKAQLLSSKVDELGSLLARIADLETEATDIKNWMKTKHGDGAYEGIVFRATISTYDVDKLDMDAVRAKLTRQFIKANTKTSTVTKCNVVARNAQNLGNKKAA